MSWLERMMHGMRHLEEYCQCLHLKYVKGKYMIFLIIYANNKLSACFWCKLKYSNPSKYIAIPGCTQYLSKIIKPFSTHLSPHDFPIFQVIFLFWLFLQIRCKCVFLFIWLFLLSFFMKQHLPLVTRYVT